MCSETPAIRLQGSEIAAAVWCPINTLSRDNITYSTIVRDLNPAMVPGLKYVPKTALKLAGADKLFFPSIELPFSVISSPKLSSDETGLPGGAARTICTASQAIGNRRSIAASQICSAGVHSPILHASSNLKVPRAALHQGAAVANNSPTPPTAARRLTAAAVRASIADNLKPEEQALADGTGDHAIRSLRPLQPASVLRFDLWGLTLGVASDLLALTQKSHQVPLNWPPVKFSGTIPSYISMVVTSCIEIYKYPEYGFDSFRAFALIPPVLIGVAGLSKLCMIFGLL